MKIKATLLALFVAGLATSFAIAAPPPGKGKNKGQTTGSTSGTTATGTTATTTTGGEKKVTICHKTGSKTNPWVKIKVSKNALPAHIRHGDMPVGPNGDCPKTPGTGGGGTTGTTGTTGATTGAAPTAGETAQGQNKGKGKKK
jgi:hypothetical protein